jgi:hypothetical protein
MSFLKWHFLIVNLEDFNFICVAVASFFFWLVFFLSTVVFM